MSAGEGRRTETGRPALSVILVCLLAAALAMAVSAQDGALSPRQQATAALEGAELEETAARALARHTDFALANRRSPRLGERLAEAERFLGYARSAYDRSLKTPSASAFRDVAALAQRAEKELVAYREAVGRELAKIEQERRPPPPPPP
ncbi:MAG: hypothetical protein AAGN66_12795, partial [Acidobacteriota bacterium]